MVRVCNESQHSHAGTGRRMEQTAWCLVRRPGGPHLGGHDGLHPVHVRVPHVLEPEAVTVAVPVICQPPRAAPMQGLNGGWVEPAVDPHRPRSDKEARTSVADVPNVPDEIIIGLESAQLSVGLHGVAQGAVSHVAKDSHYRMRGGRGACARVRVSVKWAGGRGFGSRHQQNHCSAPEQRGTHPQVHATHATHLARAWRTRNPGRTQRTGRGRSPPLRPRTGSSTRCPVQAPRRPRGGGSRAPGS